MEQVISQHTFFATGATRDLSFRRKALLSLKFSINAHRDDLYAALWQDLHKSEAEALLTEVSMVVGEIDVQLRHLTRWAGTRRVSTPLFLWPSTSRVVSQPLGVVLVMAPWNYPFNLTMTPAIGAIAAGNCVVVKPSPYTPNVARVIDTIVAESLSPEHVCVIQGDRQVNAELLAQQWDYIFFTGGQRLGRVVAMAAAEKLTPVTLELGGKSPCIVDSTANIELAARRITWGKFLNAGQTCIAPDYVLAHVDIRERLVERIKYYITEFYGVDPRASAHFGRIVNGEAFERLSRLIGESSGTIVTGGECHADELYVAPTVIANVTEHDALMQDEIFGPLLPVIDFCYKESIYEYINGRDKPLALYYFGSSSGVAKVLANTSSGGMCINDTVLHIANHHLPFGGVGHSGMGRYHGHESFVTFSNRRSVLRSPRSFDLPFKYPPFRYLAFLRKML